MSKIAYTYKEAAEETGFSDSTLRRAVASGDLVPRFYGTAPVFLHEELQGWIEALPSEKSK